MLLFIANSTGSQAGTKTFSYDAFTARWTAVDPMAAKYPGHSPFNYCEGNPLLFYDPVGQTICFFYWVSDENKTIGGSWIDGADEALLTAIEKMSLSLI